MCACTLNNYMQHQLPNSANVCNAEYYYASVILLMISNFLPNHPAIQPFQDLHFMWTASAYSEDLRWRIVWQSWQSRQSHALEIQPKKIAANLSINYSTVVRKKPYPAPCRTGKSVCRWTGKRIDRTSQPTPTPTNATGWRAAVSWLPNFPRQTCKRAISATMTDNDWQWLTMKKLMKLLKLLKLLKLYSFL